MSVSFIVDAAKGIASGRGLSGRELEINQELESRSGKRTQGFSVPSNGWSKRAYVAGTANQGGNLVATDLLVDNFIEALRSRTVVGELGETILPAKVGDVEFHNALVTIPLHGLELMTTMRPPKPLARLDR